MVKRWGNTGVKYPASGCQDVLILTSYCPLLKTNKRKENNMSKARWDASDWADYTTTTRDYASKTTEEIFSSGLHEDLDPGKIKIRESCDSSEFPESNAIVIALDVTGSMYPVIDKVAREGLNRLVTSIYDKKPVKDPHIMCMGIGDVEMGDSAPLQVTQFETDIRIAVDLEKIWIEGLGGGNRYESYTLAWYFAAMKTSIDCFNKRGKKGYLFTIGDEFPTPYLKAQDIKRVLGDGPQANLAIEQLYDMVSRTYEVFHVVVKEGNCFRYYGNDVIDAWKKVLGQRVIPLSDHTKLAEVIVSTIQACEGASKDDIIKGWDGDASMVVKNSIKDLFIVPGTKAGEVVTFS